MQLRFKIMAIVILFPTAIYLLSISLHLTILFQEGPLWQQLSESSSQTIMGEQTKDSLQSWAMQYESEQRPLINLLYGLQKMFINIPFSSEYIYELPIDPQYFYWKYQNITDLKVLRSYPIYTSVQSFWMVSPLLRIEYQNGAFDQINYVCEDGLYLSFRNNNVSVNYTNMLLHCDSINNCSNYINKFLDKIVQPVFTSSFDIWSIRCKKCLIQGIKIRTQSLQLLFNSDEIIYGISDPNYIYQYKNGVLKNSTFSQIFEINKNETEEVQFKLNDTLMQQQQIKNYSFYYQTNQTTRYAYVLALYFHEEEQQKNQIDSETLYKSSIIIYMTMDYYYHQSLSGVNDFVFQINLYRFILMIIIYLMIYLHFIRKSVMTALSFEQPIKEIIKLLNIDMIYLENDEFKFKNYKKYFNSQEIKLLYKVIISLINNIKCVNNQLLLALIRVPKKYKRKPLKTDIHRKLTSLSKSDDDDTSISHQTQTDKNGAKFLYETLSEVQALIQLCKSKKFFKKRGNFQAVGICANNISKIHMKNKRYLEAMNEQEESLLLAYQDLQSIDEVENLKQEYLKQEDANPENSKKNILWYERLTTYMLRYFRKEEDPILQQLDLVSRSVRDKQQSIFRRTTFNKQNKTNLTNVRHSQDVLELPPFDKRNNKRNLTSNGNSNWVKSPMNEISEQITENMIHSQRGERFFSELQTDYEEKRKIVIYKIIFRKYQLASILYNYTIGQIQPSFLQEVVELYDEVLFETDKCVSSDNKFNFSSIYVMRISIHTKMAFCYGKLNQFEDANFSIQKAHSNLDEYKLNSENHSDIKEMVDVFKGMPPTILEEKIAYVEARLLMMQQRHFQASQKLLNILTAKSQCDPDIQKETIRSLEYIFLKSKCKDLQFLEKLYNENAKKKIEMIFLIDYSKNMTAEQFKLAHTMCQRTIESLPEDAKIGLYLFNDTIHEIFSLLEISEYRHLTLKVFEKFLIRPGGYGNLFDALNIAVNNLFDKDKMLIEQKLRKFNIHPGSNRQTIVDQELYKQTQMHKRRSMREDFITSKVSDSICVMEKLRSHETFEYPNDEPDTNTLRYICLFCENVNNYNDKQAQRLKESLCQKNVSLQIFNIANQNMNMLYLKKLADVHDKNRFINLNEDISRFFEELKQHEQEFTKRMYLEMF